MVIIHQREIFSFFSEQNICVQFQLLILRCRFCFLFRLNCCVFCVVKINQWNTVSQAVTLYSLSNHSVQSAKFWCQSFRQLRGKLWEAPSCRQTLGVHKVIIYCRSARSTPALIRVKIVRRLNVYELRNRQSPFTHF